MIAIIKGIIAGVCIPLLLFGFGVIFGWGFWHSTPKDVAVLRSTKRIRVEITPKERRE